VSDATKVFVPPVKLRELLTLETRARTFVFWTSLALVSASVLIPRLLPCVDYPQHLALADIAARLRDPGAPEHQTHQLSYFTYNGLFHVAVASMSRVMPIELAGRLIVAASLVGLGASVLALLRTLGKPPSYAGLFVPVIFSFSVKWGFVNYALATAIAVSALVLVARAALRPRLKTALGIAMMGLLCAYAHVLAMLVLCAVGAALVPELVWWASKQTARTLKQRVAFVLGRTVAALGPLLVGCAFCVQVYRLQYGWNPTMYKDPALEGTAPPLAEKLELFASYTTGLHDDYADQVLLWTALGVGLAIMTIARSAEKRPNGPVSLRLPFVVGLGAYLATPVVLQGTHLIFQRLAQTAVLGFVLLLPPLAGMAATFFSRLSLAIALACGLSLTWHATVFAIDTQDASLVIDDMPERRAVAAIVYDFETRGFRASTLTHLQAYYAARKHGDWSYSFARYLSVPVRFRRGIEPAWPATGWEFSPENYNPRCKYARRFPLLIVKAPALAASEREVRVGIFGQDADAVRLVSHHGQFWSFDTTGLPDDGTL
jgi:hypothetical protein